MTAAIFNLNHPANTVHWHFFSMSVANVVVIVLMLVVFAVAILAPFPGRARNGAMSAVNGKSSVNGTVVDGEGARASGGGVAAGEAAARQPAVVHGVVDLRVRRADAHVADRDHRVGFDPRA